MTAFNFNDPPNRRREAAEAEARKAEAREAEARERDLLTRAAAYARSIAVLRQRAADDNRDTYTVALGQLARFGLIEDDLYDELIALPRIER